MTNKKLYGKCSGEICTIKPWKDGIHFTLFPITGNQPYLGLFEGEFYRYSKAESEALTKYLQGTPI